MAASSAKRQNRIRSRKWATTCGSWPRARRTCASSAKWRAAASVIWAGSNVGRSSSGAVKTARRTASASDGSGAARSASVTTLVTGESPVKLVRTSIRSRSETTRRGGFSRASRYPWSWRYAALRSLRLPLYSQAKKPRFQTSAKPSPPASFPAPFSNAYHEPVGSACVGPGSPSMAHRSRKWDWAEARSPVVTPLHFAANSVGVMDRSVRQSGGRGTPAAMSAWTRAGQLAPLAPRPDRRRARYQARYSSSSSRSSSVRSAKSAAPTVSAAFWSWPPGT